MEGHIDGLINRWMNGKMDERVTRLVDDLDVMDGGKRLSG